MVLVLLYCSRPSNMWRRLMVLMVLVVDHLHAFSTHYLNFVVVFLNGGAQMR